MRMFPLLTDSSLYYRFVNGPSLSGLLMLCKVRGSKVSDGLPKAVQRSTGEKTLMLTITGQKARDRGKGSEQKVPEMQTAPGNFILDEERVAYQK